MDIEVVKSSPNGQFEQDSGNEVVFWHVSNLQEEGSAVFSFSSDKNVEDNMFPLSISFDETYSIINMEVNDIVSKDEGEPLSSKVVKSLSAENYVVTNS